ncbi:hypothetical protein Aph01nite_25790 [Acrocarpospora phusangensis]|uniref:Uncharacterized protein n=1 Tax=Acrocarpospora phusangensis TaxID=1070424 RepID=A0A919Q885_9ACTN|nr:hypothetical protein [Acrocarpospora phusangensis]GIH24269.1 hypothetical protein Aph01nite_25790 [Acrocarpospora phusangensis]
MVTSKTTVRELQVAGIIDTGVTLLLVLELPEEETMHVSWLAYLAYEQKKRRARIERLLNDDIPTAKRARKHL